VRADVLSSGDTSRGVIHRAAIGTNAIALANVEALWRHCDIVETGNDR
jgi:hypothetical protein